MTNNDFCKKNILQYLGNDHPELIFFDSIDSTNNYAKELIAKNQAVDGIVPCSCLIKCYAGVYCLPEYQEENAGVNQQDSRVRRRAKYHAEWASNSLLFCAAVFQ